MDDATDTGHEKLASFMANHSQTAAFQRFDFLNTLNLLYMQAELVEQEKRLKESIKADQNSDNYERKTSTRDWYWLSLSEESGTWEDVLKTRKLLREYSEPILIYMACPKLTR